MSNDRGTFQLVISRQQVVALGGFLLAVEFCLAAVYFSLVYAHVPWWTIRTWFNMTGEGNIPTWFSSTQLFFVFLVVAYCALREQVNAQRALWRNGWWPVAMLFLYLSIDETGQIHDRLSNWVNRRVTLPSFEPSGYYWLLFLLPFMLFAVVYLVAFLWQRVRSRPRLLLLGMAGLACWILVPVGEWFEGFHKLPWWGELLEYTAEETLEMIGATCFLLVFLRYAMTLPIRARE